MRRVLTCAAALLVCANSAFAAIQINEIYFSPEDPKNDRQFFELVSTTGGVESLANLTLLEIEGDIPVGVGDNPGQILNIFDLSSYSTGSNGLFLWRDSSTVIDTSKDPGFQGPDAATTVVTQAFTQIFGYEGPTEDEFENDYHTFLLVENYSGSATAGNGVGDDLDTNEDGIFDVTPWTSVVDAISRVEELGSPTGPFAYADQVGGINAVGENGDDVWVRMDPTDSNYVAGTNEWYFFDSNDGDGELAGFQGPFFGNDGAGPTDSDAQFQDGTIIPIFANSKFMVATPGAANSANVPIIPEPTTAVLVSIVGMFGLIRRTR